MIHTVDGSVS